MSFLLPERGEGRSELFVIYLANHTVQERSIMCYGNSERELRTFYFPKTWKLSHDIDVVSEIKFKRSVPCGETYTIVDADGKRLVDANQNASARIPKDFDALQTGYGMFGERSPSPDFQIVNSVEDVEKIERKQDVKEVEDL